MTADAGDLKAVSYDKTGRVRIDHDGTVHTLRRPKWGQYRQIRDAYKALTPLDQKRVALAKDVQEKPPDEQYEVMNQLLELTDQVAAAKVPVLQLVFSSLSDAEFPEDPDQWETWLLTDDSFLAELLEHWRTVPLARGD